MAEAGARPILKLADFGLSAKCDERGQAPHEGLVGTPMYMSPELLLLGMEGKSYNAKVGSRLPAAYGP